MRKLTLFIFSLLMTIGAVAQVNITNTSSYTVKSVNRGFLYYDSANGDYVTSSSHTDLTDATPTGLLEEQFAFLHEDNTAEGQYYMYSVAAQKFVSYTNKNGGALTLTDDPSVTWTLAKNSNYYVITVPGTANTCINITNWQATHGCKVIGTGADDGNKMTLVAVDNVELGAALVKINKFEGNYFATPEAGKYYKIKGDSKERPWLTANATSDGNVVVSANEEDAAVFLKTENGLQAVATGKYLGYAGGKYTYSNNELTIGLRNDGNLANYSNKFAIVSGSNYMYNNSTDGIVHESSSLLDLPRLWAFTEVEAPAPTFEGEGTATSPYLIDSADKLATLSDEVNAGEAYEGVYFKLTSDIALSGEWTAIGNGSRNGTGYTGNAFKGVFDGGNNTISGLTITSTTGAKAAIGLFGVVDGGTVKNLNLTDVNINVASSDLAGAAIGMMLNGAIADAITVSGAVVGHDGVGGIVGRLIIDGTIANCTNNASVTSNYGGIGGIVGKAYYDNASNTSIFATIENCTNKGTITAPQYVGGIAGLARANVTNCVNEGEIVGGTHTGGIIGQLIAAGTVSGNENEVKISGTAQVGGIIGSYSQTADYHYYNVTIANNINRGEIAATQQCAAILGVNNIDGFTAMTATGNQSHYYVEGLELFGNPEDMVIDATNKFIVPVAQVGAQTFYTFAEAAAGAQAGSEIKLLANIEGDITVPANVTLNGNGFAVSGAVTAAGEITFAGVTKVGNFGVQYVNTTVNIPAGASLQLTGTGRMVIGHGCTFNITGSIVDDAAKTTDKATLVPSLKIAAGASITGNGVTFNVNNAYIVANANTTSKNSSANGTLDFNINNSIWDQTGVLAFYVPTSGKDPVVNFELKNSVLTTTSHLVFDVTKGEIVFDNSLVNQGTQRQIENRSTMTIKNGSVVNGAVATSSNAINPGTIIVENATYAVTGEFSGAAVGTGTLIIKKGANVSVGSIKAGANVTVDAEGMAAGDEINFTANLSQFTGTLSVINNDKLEAQIVDGKIVLATKPVAKIGEQGYATLNEAFAAATEGQTITMLDNATPALTSQRAITKAAVIDLGGKTLTLTEDDLYFGTTTFKNGTIVVDPSVKPSTAVFWMFANQTLTFDNVKIVATGVTGTYLIGLEGENSDLNLLNGSEILVENTTALDLDIICVNGTNTCDIKVENSKVNVTNIDGRVFFRGNYTVKDSEVNLAGITKAGFRIEVGQKLSIEGTSKVNIEGEPRDGGIHLTDASANYTKAETATVNATVNEPKVAKIGETTYKTLQAAIEAVQEGETIILVDNVNVTTPAYGQNALNHARAINFTLDLNGKTLSANTGNSVFRFNIANSGATSNVTLTIKNGKIVAGSNTWCAVMASGISADVKAIMNLENLTIEASKAGDLAVKAWDNATINANNVTVNATNAAGGFYAVGGEIVLDNCTVNQKGLHTAPYLSMAFAVSSNGKMTINSGIYSAEPTAAAEGYNQGSTHGSWVGGVMNSGGELIINGGTFSNGNFGDNALATAARGLIFADTNGKVTVNGGTFNALKSIFDFQNNLGTTSPVITVKGGNYSADPAVVTSYGSIVLDANCVVVENNGVWNVVKAAAKVGDKAYASLEEAFKAATEGCTIEILSDVTVDYAWDARKTGAKFTVPVTINGNGKTIKFTNSVNDNNYQAAFRFEADATVKNLIVDMSEVTDSRFRAISSKGNLTVDGCKFIGKNETLNCRAIIFGEGAGANVGNLAIAITNSEFINWKRGITDNENGQDVKTATITGNTLENAAVYVSAYENVTFTGNTVEGAYVDIRSYTANSSLNVTATGNTLEENTDTAYNYIKATGNIDQEGFKVYAVAKIGDVEYTTIEKAYAALQEGDEIVILKKGSYALKVKNNVTITGAVAGVEFANIGAFGCNGANVTFNNVTFTYAENSTYKGLQHSGNLVYNNCTFNGQVFLYGQSETFNGCTFNTTDSNNYNVWTYGAKEVAFNECTFNSAGKSVLIYSEQASNTNNVTVTKSQFNASQAVEGKAAIEMDSSLSGAISLTIDGETTATGFGTGNVSGNSLWNNKKGNNDVANNDITVKVGDTVVLAPIFEAQIGDAQYRFFQDAINAVQNGETITVLRDIATNVEIKEKDNVKVTIDGNGMKMTGTIKVVALSSDNDRRITIKNFKFEDTTSASVDFITSVETNHYPRITVEGCTFTGSGDATDVALRLKSSNNVEIKNCTGKGLHSFLQNTSGWNLTIENVTVTESKSAFALGTVQGVTVKGCTVDVPDYGIRMDAGYNNNAVIESNTIKAFIPVVVRKATVNSNIAVNGTNNLTATNSDGIWCAIGTSEYEANGEMPTPATGKVVVTLNDTNLDNEGIYGDHVVLAGKGTETEPYLISDIKELVAFRNYVNSGANYYAGVWVALAADIDMAGENWVGIGSATADHGFMGNFDGKGFKIKNLTIENPALDADGYAYAGLFGVTEGTDKDNQNTIKNLIIENVTINTTGKIAAAAIAYPYYTIVDNVKVCGDIKIQGGDYTAGVLAYTRRCVNASNLSIVGNDGSFVKGNQVVGGVISDIQMNGGLTAVYNNFSAEGVTVTGTKNVGGISGIIATQTLDGATVKNVTLNSSDASAAGIVAGCLGGTSTISNVTFENVAGAIALLGATYDGKAIEAKIGDTYYATLEAAYKAAQEGETITMLAPVVIASGETLTLDKNVTVDYTSNVAGEDMFTNRGTLNISAGTITYANTDATGSNVTVSTISSEPGSVLNITGGTVENKTVKADGSSIYSYAIDMLTNGNLGDVTATIAGGTVSSDYMAIRQFNNGTACKNSLTINGGYIYGAKRAVQVHLNNNAAYTTISGGKVEAGADGYAICNFAATGNLEVTGGEFIGAVYSARENFISGGIYDAEVYAGYCAEGYMPNKNVDGTYGVVLVANAYASIDGVTYGSLKAAVAAAKKGETIVLLQDINEGIVTIEKSLTLDGAGKTITGHIHANLSNVKMTVKNVKFNGDNATYDYAIRVDRASSFVADNCTADGYKYSFLYANKSNNNFTIKDVTVTNCANYGVYFASFNNATVENLTVIGAEYGVAAGNAANSKVNIKNCTFDVADVPLYIQEKGTGKVTFTFDGVNEMGNEVLYTNEYVKIVAVAQVGTKVYDNFAQAFAGAQDGQTVKLLSNISLGLDDVVVNNAGQKVLANVDGKNITFDMNGKKIAVDHRSTEAADRIFSVICVEDGAGLTVTGNGSIDVTTGVTDANVMPKVAYMFWKRGTTGYLVIEDGNYHMDNSEDSMVYTNGDDIVTVKGGTFILDANGTRVNGFPWIFNVAGNNASSINVTGGTYNYDIRKQAWNLEVKLAEGLTMRNNGDGTWTVVDAIAAVIGADAAVKESYGSIQEAINAAQDNETVQLLIDVEYTDADALSVEEKPYTTMLYVQGKNITLDLNGKNIDVTYTGALLYSVVLVSDGAGLTVTGEGSINVRGLKADGTAAKNIAYVFWKRGTTGYLVIENGTFHMNDAADSMVYTNGDEIVTINGGTFILDAVASQTNGFPVIFNAAGNNEQQIVVNGGTFNYDINHQIRPFEPYVAPEKALKKVQIDGVDMWTIVPAEAYVTEMLGAWVTEPGDNEHKVGYATFTEAIAAVNNLGKTVTLVKDVELTKTLALTDMELTLDGAGHTISQADDCNNAIALFDITRGKVAINNVVFDGIKKGAVVRTVGTEFAMDNVTAQNCEHTVGQGLFRLLGQNTITNSTFKNNTCTMVMTLNFDGASDTPQVVDNCVFDGNTANGTAVLYYVGGANCTITDSEFIGNTVNCNNNGAVVYLGFQENCSVTGNLFKDNTVYDASTSTRVAGAIFFGYEAEISGNAFDNNTASNANGDVLGQVCSSLYYEGTIDLSGNYWGAVAPVYGKDYTIQHQTGEGTFALTNYYTGYSLENGNVELSGESAFEVEFVDKQFTEHDNEFDVFVGAITYKRSSIPTTWTPFYVPFEVPVSELADKFEVAYINGIRRTDADFNGELDNKFRMEIIYIHGGDNCDGSAKTLKPNYPYFIRSKGEVSENLEITIENALLYAAEEQVYDCTTMTEKFEFIGNVKTMTADMFRANDYGVNKGEWGHIGSSAVLRPFRFYMRITSREDNEPFVSMASMSIVVRGEELEDGTTLIYDVENDVQTIDYIYDLQGRRVLEPQKGNLYIINGKKVIF